VRKREADGSRRRIGIITLQRAAHVGRRAIVQRLCTDAVSAAVRAGYEAECTHAAVLSRHARAGIIASLGGLAVRDAAFSRLSCDTDDVRF